MSVGYLWRGKCFETSSDAVDAYYSTFPVGVYVDAAVPSNQTLLILAEKVSGVWKWRVDKATYLTSTSWGFAASGVAPVPSFASCDPAAGFVDGMAVGWGIAGAMILAGAVMMMKKGQLNG